ncbi:uncharacterized protein Bfra_007472 [Botrytis fragariae]|uniref:Uncharacterized protein n=1 Tax=Botrytis fragariae TaxID=1964551 RepID=A0A8H6EDU8_9HELO|nr:uncharacterized protein Bfra_007472 [Botrytis fragariae]KAF5868275.1 hypothetical protein Bfra_007472 [Botrytis fragariae]
MKGLRSSTVQRSDKLKDGMRKTKGNCTEMVTYRTTFLIALSKKHRDTQSQMPNLGLLAVCGVWGNDEMNLSSISNFVWRMNGNFKISNCCYLGENQCSESSRYH